MQLEVKESFLNRNDIEEGTCIQARILEVLEESFKSKAGKAYNAIILRLERGGESVKLQCFNSELNAVIKGFGGNTDTWKDRLVDCYNMPTSTGRSVWKIVPAATVTVEHV